MPENPRTPQRRIEAIEAWENEGGATQVRAPARLSAAAALGRAPALVSWFVPPLVIPIAFFVLALGYALYRGYA